MIQLLFYCLVTKSRSTLCDAMNCSTPGSLPLTSSQSLLKFMSIESVMPSIHLILSPTVPLSLNLSQNQGLIHTHTHTHTHTHSFVTFSSIISYYKILSIVSCVMQQVIVDYLSYTWKVKVLVAQSCPTLCNPMDYRPPGSSVHGILQTRILEWVVTAFSRGSSWPRDWTQLSCIAGRFFTMWVTI